MKDFNNFSKQQLIEAAERFGIKPDNRWSLSTLTMRLVEAGVTPDQITAAEEVLGVSDSAIGKFSTESGGKSIVKMDRPNKSFSIMGYKFTEDHPYVVMDTSDAEMICDITEDGDFRIATPNEAAKFYKKGR